MNIGQIIEAAGDFGSPHEGGAVIQYQLAKDLIDAVELLQAGSAVEQGEGVFTHLEVIPEPGQEGFFTGIRPDTRAILLHLTQRPHAACVMLAEPMLQRLLGGLA